MNYYVVFCLNILILPQLALTQSWPPLGATWHYTAPTWPEVSFTKIISEKDTIILGQRCRKLTNLLGESGQTHSDYLTQFVYQEGQKVYTYIPSSNKFGLLYDFSKNAGESWIVETDLYDFEVTVDSIGMMMVNDSVRKVQYVDDGGLGHFRGTIIEGIGHTQYLYPVPGLADPAIGPLRCYEDSILGLFRYDHPLQGAIFCDSTWHLFNNKENKMLVTGAEWYYETYSDFWAGTYTRRSVLYYGYRVAGDTVIEGRVWKKVHSFGQFGESEGYYLLSEENNRIFHYVPQIQKSGILYDFNLNVGEQYEGVTGYYLGDTLTDLVYVDSVETILVNQVERKVQYLDINSDWFYYGKTIEGIGNILDLFPRHALDDSPGSWLRCYSNPDIGLFQNLPYPCDSTWVEIIDNIDENIHSSIHIYPNPVQEQFTLDINDGNIYISSIQLIDMKGRILKKVKMSPPRRIFAVDMTSFAPAIYVLEVELLSGERVRKKIMKE